MSDNIRLTFQFCNERERVKEEEGEKPVLRFDPTIHQVLASQLAGAASHGQARMGRGITK
jgi:hypothetical protein